MILLLIYRIALMHRSPLYAAALSGQILIYTLALAGLFLRNSALGRAPLFYVPYFFCFVNAAAFLGILSIIRGERVAAWSTRSGVKSN